MLVYLSDIQTTHNLNLSSKESFSSFKGSWLATPVTDILNLPFNKIAGFFNSTISEPTRIYQGYDYRDKRGIFTQHNTYKTSSFVLDLDKPNTDFNIYYDYPWETILSALSSYFIVVALPSFNNKYGRILLQYKNKLSQEQWISHTTNIIQHYTGIKGLITNTESKTKQEEWLDLQAIKHNYNFTYFNHPSYISDTPTKKLPSRSFKTSHLKYLTLAKDPSKELHLTTSSTFTDLEEMEPIPDTQLVTIRNKSKEPIPIKSITEKCYIELYPNIDETYHKYGMAGKPTKSTHNLTYYPTSNTLIFYRGSSSKHMIYEEEPEILDSNILTKYIPKQDFSTYINRNTLIVSPTGTGKTTLIKELIKYLTYNGIIPVVVAPTKALVNKIGNDLNIKTVSKEEDLLQEPFVTTYSKFSHHTDTEQYFPIFDEVHEMFKYSSYEEQPQFSKGSLMLTAEISMIKAIEWAKWDYNIIHYKLNKDSVINYYQSWSKQLIKELKGKRVLYFSYSTNSGYHKFFQDIDPNVQTINSKNVSQFRDIEKQIDNYKHSSHLTSIAEMGISLDSDYYAVVVDFSAKREQPTAKEINQFLSRVRGKAKLIVVQNHTLYKPEGYYSSYDGFLEDVRRADFNGVGNFNKSLAFKGFRFSAGADVSEYTTNISRFIHGNLTRYQKNYIGILKSYGYDLNLIKVRPVDKVSVKNDSKETIPIAIDIRFRDKVIRLEDSLDNRNLELTDLGIYEVVELLNKDKEAADLLSIAYPPKNGFEELFGTYKLKDISQKISSLVKKSNDLKLLPSYLKKLSTFEICIDRLYNTPYLEIEWVDVRGSPLTLRRSGRGGKNVDGFFIGTEKIYDAKVTKIKTRSYPSPIGGYVKLRHSYSKFVKEKSYENCETIELE